MTAETNGNRPPQDIFDAQFPHSPNNSPTLTRHELFDGIVPYTEFHLELLEKQRSQEMIEYIKKIQKGNMKSDRNPLPNLPQ